ncbi:hypothetical protein D3C73_1261010 [compost metagenome]
MSETLWSPLARKALIASAYSSVPAMAFSKIEGLEVTPFRPSSSIRAFKPPS